MAKLWKKSAAAVHPMIEKYTAGTDYLFDVELSPYDVEASLVHAKALQKAGILTAKELKLIDKTLQEIGIKFENGVITIKPEDEDCHTVIENYLVKEIGDVGKKVHTGRSRNDQVLVALRLYLKEHLQILKVKTLDLAEMFIAKADEYKTMPMPGYSHGQQAMLTSVGHYYASFAESLLDDANFLAAAIRHIDKNPLGSAAGFGTTIPIDRDQTTKALGFAALQLNSLYVQNSRGKFESVAMEALSQVMLTLSRFSTDMLFFTTQEAGYFKAADHLVTGSSIMPQKRNLDCLELVRGNASVVIANQLMVKDFAKNLMSGYNRDLQLMKKPLMESFQIVSDSLDVASIALKGLTPEPETLKAKIHPGIFTADLANDLVIRDNIPFRDAYRLASEHAAGPHDLQKNIASKRTLGAPGNLALDRYKARLSQQRSSLNSH